MDSLRNWRHPYLWVMLWPALALMGAVLLWTDVGRASDRARTSAERTALNEVRAISQAYEQYLSRSFAHMDQLSTQLKQTVESSAGRLDLMRLAQDGMYQDAAFACVAVLDVEGRIRSALRASACASLLPQTVAAHHGANNSSALRISVPQDGAAGAAIILSRRLESANSDYAGSVVLVLQSRYFTGFRIPLTAALDGSVTVMGTEAHWHATSATATPGLMQRVRQGDEDSGAVIVQASARGRTILGWSRSPAYPVTGMVAIADDAITAAILQATAQARRTAILGTLALGLLALMAAVLSRRAADRYSAQENVRKAYRTATEGAHDGFYMATPVRDRHGAIRDFEIVDCNERGARFYGVARHTMIGKRLSMLERAGDSLFASYLAAMEHGFHDDECRMPDHTQVRITWGQRRIVRVGSGLAITLRDVSERQSHLAELNRVANEDALTGLPNRQWLLGFLPATLARASSEVAVLFVNIAEFKQVNDTHGHVLGDQLLHACAARLKALLRPDDVVVRFGGDEFVVVLAPSEGDVHSARVAERIASAFSAPFTLGTIRIMSGACVGISVYPRDGADSNDLLRHAGIAAEAAKADGTCPYRFYEASLSRSLQGSSRMKQILLDAIAGDQFALHYQPRVDAATGRLCSMEALIRWIHPEQGMIAPLDFIPLAESTGLIVPLGELVMDKAATQLATWRAAGLPLVPVSINVSPRQFINGALPSQLAHRLREHRLDPELFEVEVTESAMMGDQAHILAQLDAIRALGIKLHVDDFGTGYSSLSQLQRLKMDVLKVDRAFTAELGHTPEGKVFFQAIVSMAHALGMTVVAEGVETEQQLRMLRELGCNEVQGYYLGKPMCGADMAALLTQPQLLPPQPPRLFLITSD